MSNAQNHHFRGFDQGSGGLPRFQLHLAGGTRGDNRRDLLAANRNRHFCHQTADANFVNSPYELISPTDAANHLILFTACTASLPEEQTIHLALRNPVMPTGGLAAANLLLVYPLLDRGEADPKL